MILFINSSIHCCHLLHFINVLIKLFLRSHLNVRFIESINKTWSIIESINKTWCHLLVYCHIYLSMTVLNLPENQHNSTPKRWIIPIKNITPQSCEWNYRPYIDFVFHQYPNFSVLFAHYIGLLFISFLKSFVFGTVHKLWALGLPDVKGLNL